LRHPSACPYRRRHNMVLHRYTVTLL
jgi:hypothetical protein